METPNVYLARLDTGICMIGELSKETKTYIELSNPAEMLQTSSPDPYTGRNRDFVFLKSMSEFTEENTIRLIKTRLIQYSKPISTLEDLYYTTIKRAEVEKKKMQEPQDDQPIDDGGIINSLEDLQRMIDEQTSNSDMKQSIKYLMKYFDEMSHRPNEMIDLHITMDRAMFERIMKAKHQMEDGEDMDLEDYDLDESWLDETDREDRSFESFADKDHGPNFFDWPMTDEDWF